MNEEADYHEMACCCCFYWNALASDLAMERYMTVEKGVEYWKVYRDAGGSDGEHMLASS